MFNAASQVGGAIGVDLLTSSPATLSLLPMAR